MKNIGGGLGFAATLDIDDFNVSAEAMDRHFRHVSTNIQLEAEDMEKSLLNFAQKGAMYIQSYLVGHGMLGLLNSIIQVRGQFQQLEIAFTTMLGSEQKASQLMNQMIQTAAKTPFDLAGIAGGAKQLLAYGESAERVNDTLVRLGNIASGLSIPLNDIVYLYGTTMVQGRLYAQDVRQFTGRGIPLVKELAKMYGVTAEEINNMVSAGKIGFPEVEKVLRSMTDQGGQFYNLMEKQSASLTGMLSNLSDAWDSMLNDIGRANQEVFAEGIDGATYLVEHYQQILDILEAVAVSYGTVRAAIMLNTLATKGYTGVALIDNTARQAKLALLKAEAVATGQVAAQEQTMTAARLSHVEALEKELTASELLNLQNKIRAQYINSLLTAQQAEYLSNLGLTTSSQNYEAAAMQVLTVEQRQAVQKLDLSAKSAIYHTALENEVIAKKKGIEASNKKAQAELAALKQELAISQQRYDMAQMQHVQSLQRVDDAKYELWQARKNATESKIYQAQKQLGIEQDKLAIAQKRLLAATTDLNAKKKAVEAASIIKSTAASSTDTVAKGAQTVATNALTTATGKLRLAMATLWQTMKANPIGWIVSVLGLAFTAFTMFRKEEVEVTEQTVSLDNALKKATDEFNTQAAKVDALRKVMEDSNASYEQKKKAYKDLKEIIPEYNAELSKEGKIIRDNKKAIDDYLVSLEKQIKLKAAQEELEAAYKKKRQLENTKKASLKDLAGAEADENNLAMATGGIYGNTKTNKIREELKQTDDQIKVVNATINDLTKEIQTSTVATDTSTKKIKTYKEQVEDAEAKVKKLNQEITDMRTGKVVDENLAKAIADKQKDLVQANSDLAALTGRKISSGRSTGDTTNSLSEKQLEAQRKLEEARIAVMEEGYAKRKATLDLQHQMELDRINKEEKELEKARKKAGKGGLSDSEKQSFEERRKLANRSYDTESIKLFDGEIAYKKQQYEAYFNWVRNVGQDVADAHFKNLLADGSSFITWVNSQIAQLEAKKEANPKDFTMGDANALNSLKAQLNELTGQKSNMDLFKESLTQSIRQAQTLAQKLQAVADIRDRLARGEFHLNTDEQAQANLNINQTNSDLNSQISQEILDKYKTFEEKKQDIIEEYQALRLEAERLGMSERVAMINQGEAEALSALNAQMLMQSESWKNLFGDLDSLTVEQIDTLIKDIQDKMSTADLKLNPADMKAALDKLDEAKRKVLDTNPFKALGNALSDVFKKQQNGSKKTAEQIKNDWSNLGDATKDCFDFVDDAIDSCSVLSDLLGETGQSVISTLSGIATAGVAMASAIATAEKGSVILAAISIALQAIQFVANLFNNDEELENRIQSIQRNVDELESSLNRLQNAYEHTYWSYSQEEEEAYKKRIQDIEDTIQELNHLALQQFLDVKWDDYDKTLSQIKDLEYELEKAQKSGDMSGIYETEIENLRQQQVLIRNQIDAEKDKKDSDLDKISQWEEKIKDIDDQIEDMERSMTETFAGTDVKSAIDEFADALVDAYDQGIDRVEVLGKKTKEVLRNAVKEALKRQFLAEGINDAVKYLGSAMSDNILSDSEREHFEELVNQAGAMFNNALDGIGDWIKNAEEKAADPLTGAVQGMSEETGGIVAGRMNAVVINQSEMLDVMRQQLQYQAEIAYNTSFCKRLDDIAEDLRSLKNSGNPLLSQGIS